MKQFLRFRGYYCPKRIQPICLFLLTASLLLGGGWHNAYAQFYKPSAISKSVGDTLPDSFFGIVHQAVHARTGEATTIKLADHRDKLIILDFWATWCKPCIGSLNKLDSMRHGIDTTGFVVIPVTYQTAKEASPAFERFAWGMTSIVADTTLVQLFPHGGIPHMIWIKDGKVLANPVHYFATAENILNACKSLPLNIRNERKLFDVKKLFAEWSKSEELCYQSAILHGAPDYHQQSLTIEHGDGRTFAFLGNGQLLRDLYGYAFECFISPYFGRLGKAENRGIHVEAPDSLHQKLYQPKPEMGQFTTIDDYQTAFDTWYSKFYYTYLFCADTVLSEKCVLEIMRHDINAYFGAKFGMEGVMGKRPKKLASLTTVNGPTKTADILRTKGGTRVYRITGESPYMASNYPYSSILSTLYHAKVLPDGMPLLDNTSIDGKELFIDFEFALSATGDLADANRQLARYGLRLTVEERMEPVLIIRPKQDEYPAWEENN